VKRRVYKSTSEDREGDLVNVILAATVYISSPFACLPSLKSSWREKLNCKSTHELFRYARNATLHVHAVCCLAPQARRIVVPDF
jgi:hypothetical protein